jgi:hypothetical protein
LAPTFAALVQAHGCKAAGPVKTQVRIQVSHVELRRLGVLARDVSVTDVLADHGPVLAFHQRIVLAAARPALGELRVQFLSNIRTR